MFHPSSPSSLPPPLLPSSSPHPPPSLLQAVLAGADIAVLRCVIVEVHPDRTSRKIPRSLQPAKTSIQIGKISAVTSFISSCELSDLVHLIVCSRVTVCSGSGLSHGTVRDAKPAATRPVQVLLCVWGRRVESY